jgi:N-acetyl-anhydromuramyl-L-alanine amidase AmpD
MKASDIVAHEADFDATLTDSDGIKFNAQVSLGFTFPLTVLNPVGRTGFYKNEAVTKNMVVLHYTCGYLKGDLATLTEQDNLVSVPFVLGRNGRVYQLFSSANWSYHLGSKCAGGNLLNSRRSIAIEVSNIGPLTLDPTGQTLRTIYGDNYCNIGEVQYYTKLPNSYRGYTYYASFTDAQYMSLRALTIYLCQKFSIPQQILPVTTRYDTFSDAPARTYTGIASHVNFRVDGKTDIGPAFNWSTLLPSI